MAPGDSLVGRTLGHYRFLEKVGQGGMGVVYRGQDTRLNREVALKLVSPDLVTDADSRRRFVREAQAASVLTHPNVCTIHAIEEEEGQLFLVLEYLEGASLKERAAELRGNLKALLEVLSQGAEGLAEAHRHGIVHRDIKSANLLITPRGQVKLVDFGLAKRMEEDATETDATRGLTGVGVTLGTTQYMSPEQALGREVDPRSDIFSFGVVMYEAATGALPFAGRNAAEIYNQILNHDPPPPSTANPDLPAEFDRIVLKALRKDPGERYQTAADLVVDLKALRREFESGSRPRLAPATPYPAPSGSFAAAGASGAGHTPAPRRHSALGTAGLVLAALAVVVGVTVAGVTYLARRNVTAAPVAASGKPTLAVLTFENRTGDARLNWYGNGVGELLGVELAKLPNVDVISKQRIFDVLGQLKSRGGPAALDASVATEVARKSGATLMVHGDVLQLSGDVIVTAEIVDVASGRALGAERVAGFNEQNMLGKVEELGTLLRERLKEVKS
jgi:TolB-like protein/predicted Ser/Thr protein kinase